MKIALAESVISELMAEGVVEFCIGYGTQSMPFIAILLRSPQFRVHRFVDERSAAFFALGRAKTTGRPVAIVTTSGTAVAELFPAVIEAYYTSVRLVLITGDKWHENRGTGAAQTIDQVNIFGAYVSECIDIGPSDPVNLQGRITDKPLHINLSLGPYPFDKAISPIPRKDGALGTGRPVTKPASPQDIERLRSFLKTARSPYVILGALNPADVESVCNFLLRLSVPILAEASSQLREDPRLSHLRLKSSGAGMFNQGSTARFDSVIRIGGIPSGSGWGRATAMNPTEMKILSISGSPFSGSHRSELIHVAPRELFPQCDAFVPTFDIGAHKALFEFDERIHHCMLELFRDEPRAEESLIHALSLKIPIHSTVYLGNSMPIREWDHAATYQHRGFLYSGNRGANGIDGQVSTFLGFSRINRENWGILGDLTTLHDSGGLWILPELNKHTIRLVIVNNGGGRLFDKARSRLPEFQGVHGKRFAAWAQFWDVHYQAWEQVPETFDLQQHSVIELLPDHEATRRSWEKFGNILKHE